MQKVLLDTDILSEYFKGFDLQVLRKGDAYASVHGKFTITSITVYEIVRGFEEKSARAQVAKFLAWLEKNEEVVPVSADYLAAATMKASVRRLGMTVELPDCLIAAIASRLGFTLVTGNTADFQAIKKAGVKITLEDWRKPDRDMGSKA